MPDALRRPIAIIAVLALAVAACGPTTNPSPSQSAGASGAPPSTASAIPSASAGPSPTPLSSEELAAIYGKIDAQVEALRGLEARENVDRLIRSPEEMADVLERLVREDTPPDVLASYEALYHVMGLMPESENLADVYVDLLSSQVAGLYNPKEQRLYVVSKGGGVGPVEKVFYAHEYVHALQDQHFDLQAFQPEDLVDQSDRQLARQSLVEGDAYVAMTYWLQSNLGPQDLVAFLNASQDPATQEALERIPPIVAAQIIFAAGQGTLWVLGLQTQGGWAAVDAAYANPPESSEQVLHPDKWQRREPPIQVDLPPNLAAALGTGWSVELEDTFGEAQLAVWLTGTVGDPAGLPPAPPVGAAGWGGDRMALLKGPGDDRAMVMKTDWDTEVDAQEFEEAITAVLADAPGPGQVLPGEGGTVRWVLIATDDATLQKVAGALGLAG